jgi:hypothetical protein
MQDSCTFDDDSKQAMDTTIASPPNNLDNAISETAAQVIFRIDEKLRDAQNSKCGTVYYSFLVVATLQSLAKLSLVKVL